MPTRRASTVLILAVVYIDMLGIGLAFPILPRLIQHFVGGDFARASWIFGLISSVYALAQFFLAPILGGISDRFGRRPVILLALLGHGSQLSRHGVRAEPRLAGGGPSRRGCDGRDILHGERLSRRHHAAGKARAEFRPHRGCVRVRIHHRSGLGRLSGRHRHPPAVPVRRGFELPRSRRRLFLPAGVARAGTSQGLQLRDAPIRSGR